MTIKGKIVGVFKARTLAGSPLLFRQGWAGKFGVAQPKNAAEFADLRGKFASGDPGGNGRADTHAPGSGVDTLNRFCLNFFRNMFRVPYNWRKNPDDSLTYFIETDESRQTLDYMHTLRAAGVFHPDAATLNSQQNKDTFAAGKIGAYGDTITDMPGQFTNVPKTTPTAKVVGLVPSGHDGGPAVSYNSLGWASYVAISARAARDKGRLQELLRIFDYFCAPFGSEESKLHWVRDAAFREDDSRVRAGDGAENRAVLRHFALNLLRQEWTARGGIATKRFRVALDETYLLTLLTGLAK